jgi:hypothetical protein
MRLRSIALFLLGFTVGMSILIVFVVSEQFHIQPYSTYPFRTICPHIGAIAATFLLGAYYSNKIGTALSIGTLAGVAVFIVVLFIPLLISLALGGGQ